MKLNELKQSMAEQNTFDWKVERLGKFTSSIIGNIKAKPKDKSELVAKTALNKIADVAAQRHIAKEVLADHLRLERLLYYQEASSKPLTYGHEYEPEARNCYRMETGYRVDEVGLIDHPKIPYLAGSPDGIVVGDDEEVEGVIEIKCPIGANQMLFKWNINDGESLKATKEDYYWQCQNNMNVTGAKWCDFVIYTPFLDEVIKIVRIERNEKDIKLINERVEAANKFIEQHERVDKEPTEEVEGA